jgi:hypothetical protein
MVRHCNAGIQFIQTFLVKITRLTSCFTDWFLKGPRTRIGRFSRPKVFSRRQLCTGYNKSEKPASPDVLPRKEGVIGRENNGGKLLVPTSKAARFYDRDFTGGRHLMHISYAKVCLTSFASVTVSSLSVIDRQEHS